METAKNILDVGTGTGLIALMLAQRCKAKITALEADFEAFTVADQNFKGSPFNLQIQIHHGSLQNFQAEPLFDLVVCNPPYFENSLKPPTVSRQQQRHTDSLPFNQLLDHANRLLTAEGKLSVVLPTQEGNRFIELATSRKFFLLKSMAVFSKIGKPQERWLLEFTKIPSTTKETKTLTLLDSSGQHTEEYKMLTRDFYLNF